MRERHLGTKDKAIELLDWRQDEFSEGSDAVSGTYLGVAPLECANPEVLK